MTITFDPSTYGFGDVSVGLDDSVAITITNSGASAVPISGPSAPFTMSPASVSVAASGSVTVTIVFSPSATGLSNDSIDGGGVSCTLSGTGINASTTTGGDITTTTGTHMLFKVPDFSDGTFEQANNAADSTVTTMTSYLRLGTFDIDDESEKAKWLLDLIPKKTASTDPQATAATTSPTEFTTTGTIFVDDIRTRAQDTATGNSAIKATYGDYDRSLATTDDPGNKLTMTQRQEESARLYSRGGWRDHSDGNRVTTTYGDKVEVIRGNYKMIVMGRQDNVGEAMGWEASGSHCQDFSPGTMPGASFFLEWINDPRYYAPELVSGAYSNNAKVTGQKGVWMLVNTTENVYEYARYAGNFREERWGDVLETYIGSENPPSSGAFATDSTTGNNGHEPPARLNDRNYDLPKTGSSSTNRATPPWSVDNVGKIRSNPHIIERKWAKRIDSHIGSSTTRVDTVREEHYAGTFNEVIDVSGSFTTDFNAKTFTETFQASKKLEEKRIAPKIVTVTQSDNIAGGWGMSSITEYFYGNFFELFVGASESVKAGIFIDATIGLEEINLDLAVINHLDVEVASAATNITIAAAMAEVIMATQWTYNVGQEFELTGAQAVKLALGGAFYLGPLLSLS